MYVRNYALIISLFSDRDRPSLGPAPSRRLRTELSSVEREEIPPARENASDESLYTCLYFRGICFFSFHPPIDMSFS